MNKQPGERQPYYTCSLCHGRGWIAYGDQNPIECPKCEQAAEEYYRLKEEKERAQP